MGFYVPPAADAINVQLIAGYVPPSATAIAVVLGQQQTTGGHVYAGVVARFRAARNRRAGRLDAAWLRTGTRDLAGGLGWGNAATARAGVVASWTRDGLVNATRMHRWMPATASGQGVRSRYLATYPSDRRRAAKWGCAARLPPSIPRCGWVRVYATDDGRQALWGRAGLPVLIYQRPATDAYVPPDALAISVTLAAGYVSPAADGLNVTLTGTHSYPPLIVQQADPGLIVVRWARNGVAEKLVDARWGPGSQYRRPDPPPIDSGWTGSPNEPPPIPTARRVYIVMNEVQVVRLPDRTPIEVNAVDLSATVDAWCWSLRMELADAASWALLKPDGNGPKLVEITMNSYVWTAIIEDREGMRAHANRSVTVTGRSQTALLSDTYTAVRSLAVSDARSAQQLANQELLDRAAPFTIDWRGLDWVVPGGNWYYQDLAPMAVISQIAAARGAVVQSAPGDAKLIVQSRYPVSPWAWTPAAADVALPIDWCTDETVQQQSKPMYDAVIIAGTQQGVLAKVSRSGSAASTFASQVVDQLIVTPDVATERGRNVLADRGMQWQVDLQIPLHAPGDVTAGMSGLYAPLLLVDVQDPADPYQAQSVGVTISARRGGDSDKALEIWQRVSLERHLSDAN